MITKIETIDDVKAFAKQLIDEGLNFHPDDDFHCYEYANEIKPFYTKEQADLRNALMESCFEVCEREGVDIYDTMLEITLIETGLDKYIPLPSQEYAGVE